ncbi:MAG: CBS domain-containing protein [Chitinispirillia bacterium]|jgi:acetoin utilization protein AcuB
MPKAKSVMEKNVVTVYEDTLIKDAIKKMVDNSVCVLVVVTNDFRVLGVLSAKELVHLKTNPDELSSVVNDYMVCNVICFNEEDDLADICECLRFSCFSSVPILSNGRLSGMITRLNILQNM